MSNSFMNRYFGPLPKEYCFYFYGLSVFFAFTFMLSAISIVYYMATHSNKLSSLSIINAIAIVLNSSLAYLTNRLLYNMCINSI